MEVATRWCGQLVENPEFEEEDHSYPTKFHGDQVILQVLDQVNRFSSNFKILTKQFVLSLILAAFFVVCGFILRILAAEDGKYDNKKNGVKEEARKKKLGCF